MINETLQKLGLNDKETQVYLTTLKQGKTTHAQIAKLTKINRTTVYSVAKELIKKGYITEDLGAATTYLIPREPQDLRYIIKKEEQILAQKKQLTENAIQELQALSKNTKYSIPKIVFIDEADIENYLYKQTSTWNQSIQENDPEKRWWGFQDASLIKYFEKWIDWYWDTVATPDVSLRLLSNQTAESIKKRKFARREIKFWKGSKDFTGTTWVNGNYIIIIITNQHPHYLIEIHDTTLAHNMRELFKGIWKQLKD